jgi:glycine oxidase
MTQSVVVVGGGIIGCAIAYELAKVGCAVTLLERGLPGAEASSAAAGLLAPVGESRQPGPFQELALKSWRLYPAVVAELREQTGVDVEHMTAGTLYPILHRTGPDVVRERTTWPLAREFGVRMVEAAELAGLEPALSKEVRWALFVQGDHWVNNQRLVAAYATAAARRGATLRNGTEASRILVEGGRARGVIADGERIAGDWVILAAGAWSGTLAGPGGVRLPVAPVRGQMFAVNNVPPLLAHAVHAEKVYLVPRPSGELLVGATVEHAGFLRAVTPDGIGGLIAAATELVPELGQRPIVRSWCGFRPWAPDGLPILGPWPDVEGLLVATGHYRNGILLAPVTAAALAECVLTGRAPAMLGPFLPDRFIASRQD